MEPENINLEAPQNEQPSSLHKVTPFSKYLAMALFILLPFVGGYVGYALAPEKVVEVERVVGDTQPEQASNSTHTEIATTDEPSWEACSYLANFMSQAKTPITLLVGICDQPNYVLTGEKVYYVGQDNWGGPFVPRIEEVTDADAATFELIEIESKNQLFMLLAKDKNYVYYGSEMFADPSSFSILGWGGYKYPTLVSRDDRGVYLGTEKIEGIDPETVYFKEIESPTNPSLTFQIGDKRGNCLQITTIGEKNLPPNMDPSKRHCIR